MNPFDEFLTFITPDPRVVPGYAGGGRVKRHFDSGGALYDPSTHQINLNGISTADASSVLDLQQAINTFYDTPNLTQGGYSDIGTARDADLAALQSSDPALYAKLVPAIWGSSVTSDTGIHAQDASYQPTLPSGGAGSIVLPTPTAPQTPSPTAPHVNPSPGTYGELDDAALAAARPDLWTFWQNLPNLSAADQAAYGNPTSFAEFIHGWEKIAPSSDTQANPAFVNKFYTSSSPTAQGSIYDPTTHQFNIGALPDTASQGSLSDLQSLQGIISQFYTTPPTTAGAYSADATTRDADLALLQKDNPTLAQSVMTAIWGPQATSISYLDSQDPAWSASTLAQQTTPQTPSPTTPKTPSPTTPQTPSPTTPTGYPTYSMPPSYTNPGPYSAAQSVINAANVGNMLSTEFGTPAVNGASIALGAPNVVGNTPGVLDQLGVKPPSGTAPPIKTWSPSGPTAPGPGGGSFTQPQPLTPGLPGTPPSPGVYARGGMVRGALTETLARVRSR